MNTSKNSHSSASFINTVRLHTPKTGQQTRGTAAKDNCSTTAQKLYKANPILEFAEAQQVLCSLPLLRAALSGKAGDQTQVFLTQPTTHVSM